MLSHDGLSDTMWGFVFFLSFVLCIVQWVLFVPISTNTGTTLIYDAVFLIYMQEGR